MISRISGGKTEEVHFRVLSFLSVLSGTHEELNGRVELDLNGRIKIAGVLAEMSGEESPAMSDLLSIANPGKPLSRYPSPVST